MTLYKKIVKSRKKALDELLNELKTDKPSEESIIQADLRGERFVSWKQSKILYNLSNGSTLKAQNMLEEADFYQWIEDTYGKEFDLRLHNNYNECTTIVLIWK